MSIIRVTMVWTIIGVITTPINPKPKKITVIVISNLKTGIRKSNKKE